MPRIFVSATSRDLGSFRRAVSDALLALDVQPVVQDDPAEFPPDYRAVVDMLRAKIERCDAAICLVGLVYGQEPRQRSADAPRRSYTQLEYEIAVDLRKPAFLFLATNDCPWDDAASAPEDDELRGLQLEHIKRLVDSDRLRVPFRSREHLIELVRRIRFDAASLAHGVTKEIVVVLTAELVDTGSLRREQGEEAWARDVLKPYQELLKRVLIRWKGAVQSESPTECQVNFETADAAANAALDLHHVLRLRTWAPAAPGVRIGIDTGQVIRCGGLDDARTLQSGQVLGVSQRLARLARAGQTLLTRAACDFAREHVRQLPFQSEATVGELGWERYGRYIVAGLDEPIEICEVGVKGEAPLAAPSEADGVERADSVEERQMWGWQPAVAQEIPRRPGWFIESKLGEGGFGEVWIARDRRYGEPRVFKFCYDAARLTTFKRELALFRLLRDTLGRRDDIARLVGWQLQQAPFYLESEYVEGGNLREWCKSEGRLSALPLAQRVRLVAEIAKAVAAAHSVGVIHKDLKPSNIFLRQDTEGCWHPILADFGIGAVADRSLLEQRGIPATAFNVSLLDPSSGRSGTRMYQPPEASLGRPATVQADVFALGVLLYQMIIGDLDQPLGIGWERRLAAADVPEGVSAGAVSGALVPGRDVAGKASAVELAPPGDAAVPDASPSERAKIMRELLRRDIFDGVHGDPELRLGSAAQLAERLESLDARVARDEVRRHLEQEAIGEHRRLQRERRRAEQARRQAEEAARRARRLRAALGVYAAVLTVVVALAASVFAQWKRAAILEKLAKDARIQARAHKTRAEASELRAQASAEAASEHGRLAMDTLHDVIFHMQRSLANFPVASPVRRRLLATALNRLERLSGEYVERPGVDRPTAAAPGELGDMILRFGAAPGEAGGARAGELRRSEMPSAVESARPLYTRALEIARALSDAGLNATEAIRDLWVSCNRVGDMQLALGSAEKALQYYQNGLELSELLTKADPNSADAKRDLSVSYQRVGNAQLDLGLREQALESYSNALELSEALAKADPNRAEAKRVLSISRDSVGDAQFKLGWAEKALQSYRTALGLRESLAKADPNSAEAKRDLSISYQKVGNVQLSLGWAQTALRSYEKGLALREALAMADPNSAEATSDLAIVSNALAWLLATTWEKPVRDGKRAIELATKASELSGWNDPIRLDTLAAAYAEVGRFDDAVKRQQQALANAKDLPTQNIEQMKARLKLFEARKPYHQARPEPGPGAKD
jgi:serine/threonine protein kinase